MVQPTTFMGRQQSLLGGTVADQLAGGAGMGCAIFVLLISAHNASSKRP
jgi:hypothetical protein